MQDAIGDRLDHPERVPAEYQHLIADDVQRVRRIVDLGYAGRVLDVGCSDGAILARIGDRYPVNAYGVEPNGPARFRAEQRGLTVYAELPMLSAVCPPFDHILLCEVLEHQTDEGAAQLLADVLPLLAPDGCLTVTVPNRDCDERYTAGCRDRWRWPDHRSVWTAGKLWHALARSFQDIQWVAHWSEDVPYYLGIFLIARAKGTR